MRQPILPGDMLGFCERSPLGAAINLCTFGLPGWGLSHVGLVAPNPRAGIHVLYESTAACPQPCIFAGERVDGIQAHWIGPRVIEYPGRVWHYPLSEPLDASQIEALTEYCQAALGIRYDYLGAWRARSILCGWWLHRVFPESLHALFCSEFVAACLRHVGRFPTRSASRWSPNLLARALVRHGVCSRPIRLK